MNAETAGQAECEHCGIRFAPGENSSARFCCKGCEFVYDLIRQEGLERFYDLKRDEAGIPAGDRPFEPSSFDWVAEEVTSENQRLGVDGVTNSLTCSVRGVTCIGCVWLIEKVFLREEGALRASVDPGRGIATFTWDPLALNFKDFAEKLARFGYTLRPGLEAKAGSREGVNSPGARLGICGALALNTMAFTLPRYLGMAEDFFLASLFELITIISATMCFLVGGTWFIARALHALRHRVLHIDVPIAIGITAAFATSITGWVLGVERLLYADFVATFTFLMLGGRHIHLIASRRFQNQAQDESEIARTVERVLPDKGPVAIAELKRGDNFLVKPGNVVPVAAHLVSPSSVSCSLAWMTGEPDPVSYRPPALIPAGARNLDTRPIQVAASEPWKDSLVSRLSGPEESAGDASSASPTLAKVLKIYLMTVLAIATAGGISWLLLAGSVPALEVFIAVLVISCPCAIGVALPLVDQRAAFAMQRIGVFVRSAEIWSKLRRVRHVLLDKTGTVTLERPALKNPSELGRLGDAHKKALASMVSGSLHPLSRTLAEELVVLGFEPSMDSRLENIPGVGLRLDRDGDIYTLTKADADQPHDCQATCQLSLNSSPLAVFRFEEETRPSAMRTMGELQKLGLKPAIVSGDKQSRVEMLGSSLGLPECAVHGNLSPSQKAEVVRQVGADSCLVIGDGGNDSLAFDTALVSGSPATRDALLQDRADFVFTGRGLDFLPTLLRLAGWRASTVRLVLILSITYNLIAVSLCLAGMMNPLLAAILMPLSSVATLLVAARRNPFNERKWLKIPEQNGSFKETPGTNGVSIRTA